MGIGLGRAVSLILSIPEDRGVWDARRRREGVAGPGQGAPEVTLVGRCQFCQEICLGVRSSMVLALLVFLSCIFKIMGTLNVPNLGMAGPGDLGCTWKLQRNELELGAVVGLQGLWLLGVNPEGGTGSVSWTVPTAQSPTCSSRPAADPHLKVLEHSGAPCASWPWMGA